MRRLFVLAAAILTILCLAVPTSAGSAVQGNILAVERDIDPSFETEDMPKLAHDRNLWTKADGTPINRIPADYEGYPLYFVSSYPVDIGGSAVVSFSTPCNLDLYTMLRITCRANVTGRPSNAYSLTVRLSCGDETITYTASISANGWHTVDLDLAAWPYRGAIDRIELRLDGNAALQFLHLNTNMPLNAALRDRFLTERFDTQGGRIHMSPGVSMAYFVPTDNSPMLTANILVPANRTETNAIRFVFENETACRSVTLQYAYNTTGANARSVTHDVGEGRQICLFEVPDAARVRYIRLIFTGAKDGLLTLHALNAVSIYENNISHLGTVTSCAISANGREIEVKGTVAHDVMITNRENCLALFPLDSWDTVEAALTDGRVPAAIADISIRFSFSLPLTNDDYAALAAGYLVTIRSGSETEGYTYTPIADPHSLTVAYTAPKSDASAAIKGVQTELVSTASQAGAAIYFVDLYLDLLCPGSTGGYRYIGNIDNLYFDRAVLDSLDEAVRQRSTAGEAVYLRFLISDDGPAVDFAPDVLSVAQGATRGILLTDSIAQNKLGAITAFLTSRYNGGTAGSIAGIIVGRQVDDAASHNAIGQLSLSDYVDHYGDLLTLIANSARRIDPTMQVIVPISDRRPAECITADMLENSYDSELFLRSLFKRLDDLSGPAVSLMLESAHNPFSLVDGVLQQREDAEADAAIDEGKRPDYYNADALGDFSSLLDTISANYAAMPSTFLYCWTPDADTGDALSAAYAYLYYRLRFSTRAEAFIVSFAEAESNGSTNGMIALRHLMKYIDTNRSLEVSEPSLAVFGADSWHDLIIGFDESRLAGRSWIEGELAEPSNTAIGIHSYWDFRTAHSTRGWYAGTHIGNLSVSGIGDDRALTAQVNREAAETGAYSEILYHFDPGEPLSLLDRLVFDLAITGDGVWEICITAGSAASTSGRLEQKRTLNAGQRVTLCLETYRLEHAQTDYLRISIKPITGSGNGKLSLYTVTGESDSLAPDALASRLRELRLPDGEIEAAVESKSDLVWLFVACAAVITTIAIAVLLGRHQEELLEKEDTRQ